LKLDKILAGTLAFVLVIGISTPAFGQESENPSISDGSVATATVLLTPSNGAVDIETIFSLVPESACINVINFQTGQDFIPNADNMIAIDVLITPAVLNNPNPFTVNIYEGSVPLPGANNQIGTTSTHLGLPSVGVTDTVHFTFPTPVMLTPGQPHAIELLVNDGSSDFAWSVDFGDNNRIPGDVQCGLVQQGFEYLFATYFEEIVNGPVGGELFPIDTTSLMLAGLQSSAIWMIPTLAGLAGAGFYLIKFRTNKK